MRRIPEFYAYPVMFILTPNNPAAVISRLQGSLQIDPDSDFELHQLASVFFVAGNDLLDSTINTMQSGSFALQLIDTQSGRVLLQDLTAPASLTIAGFNAESSQATIPTESVTGRVGIVFNLSEPVLLRANSVMAVTLIRQEISPGNILVSLGFLGRHWINVNG